MTAVPQRRPRLVEVWQAVTGPLLPHDEVAAARDALAGLRWHPALRRRAPQVHAEVLVRAASASAALEGARVPEAVLRRAGATTGSGGDGGSDPAAAIGLGALRAMLAGDARPGLVLRAPAQALARLHVAATGDLATAEPGRPRPGAADAVQDLCRLLAAAAPVPGGQAPPAVVTAAVAIGELAAVDAFAPVTGVVARAAARLVVTAAGLDPFAVGLPEVAAAAEETGYRAALAGHATGGIEGAAAWITWWCRAVAAGAGAGRLAADAVSRGVSA